MKKNSHFHYHGRTTRKKSKRHKVLYLECSCYDRKEIIGVFQEALRTFLSKEKPKQSTNILNFVLFGDSGVGKNEIIRKFAMKKRVNVFDKPLNEPWDLSDSVSNYFTVVEIDGEEYCLEIHTKSEDRDEKEILKCADLFIFVYSIDQLNSYKVIENRTTELKKQYPKIPLVLVANKIDLRINSNSQIQSFPPCQPLITTYMGKELAEKISASKHLECSCFDEARIENLFEEAIWISLPRVEIRQRKKKRFAFLRNWF